jgi:hypothetical protein
MCICCDKKISLLYPETLDEKSEEDIVFNKENRQIYGKKGRFDEEIELNAGSQMWNDGVVNLISAGYGSRFDGDEFIIAICDDCLEKKLMTGNLAFINNYMTRNFKDETYNNYRTAWRRYNKIDDILND